MPALGRWWMSLSANSLRVRATVIVSLLLQEPYHCQQDKTYKTNGQLRNDQAYPCNKQYQALVGTRVADIEADHGTTDCNHPEYRGHHSQYQRSEEHTSELQSRGHLVCRLLLEKKNKKTNYKFIK